MNRSKIEWCDHTWNPITGCRHGCPYCYARKIAVRFAGDIRMNLMSKADYDVQVAADGNGKVYILTDPMQGEAGTPIAYPFGFEPTYHRYRKMALERMKMGKNVFVGSMADMFGAWVPSEWIQESIAECLKHPQHNYLFVTKNPDRYVELEAAGILPHGDYTWWGATVTGVRQLEQATDALCRLPPEMNTFFSVEPILEDLSGLGKWKRALKRIKWIIVGAETGRSRTKVIPEREWIQRIVTDADETGIPVFMKDSLLSIIGEEDMRREHPKELQRRMLSPKMEKKLCGTCVACETRRRKAEMIVLLAKLGNSDQTREYGFMCKECFVRYCRELGVDVPKLEGMEDAQVE